MPPAARGLTLPARILELLRASGPSYTTAIAERLDSSTGPVSGALASLKARGLVEVAAELAIPGSRRVHYRAVEQPAAAPEPRGAALERLDSSIAELRLEARFGSYGGDPEIAQLVYGNTRVRGL